MDRPPRLIAALGFVAVLATALLVSGSSSADPSTVAAAPDPPPSLTYADRGPRAVGYRVFTAPGGHHRLTLRAWYPTSRSDDAAASIT